MDAFFSLFIFPTTILLNTPRTEPAPSSSYPSIIPLDVFITPTILSYLIIQTLDTSYHLQPAGSLPPKASPPIQSTLPPLILRMDAIYSVQDELKKDRGLTKVKAVHNPNYKRHGTKVSNLYEALIPLLPSLSRLAYMAHTSEYRGSEALLFLSSQKDPSIRK